MLMSVLAGFAAGGNDVGGVGCSGVVRLGFRSETIFQADEKNPFRIVNTHTNEHPSEYNTHIVYIHSYSCAYQQTTHARTRQIYTYAVPTQRRRLSR